MQALFERTVGLRETPPFCMEGRRRRFQGERMTNRPPDCQQCSTSNTDTKKGALEGSFLRFMWRRRVRIEHTRDVLRASQRL